jgi:hypothetical protein
VTCSTRARLLRFSATGLFIHISGNGQPLFIADTSRGMRYRLLDRRAPAKTHIVWPQPATESPPKLPPRNYKFIYGRQS